MTDLLLGSVGMFCALGEGSSWGESGPVGKNIQLLARPPGVRLEIRVAVGELSVDRYPGSLDRLLTRCGNAPCVLLTGSVQAVQTRPA
jgi:hypothetical protein